MAEGEPEGTRAAATAEATATDGKTTDPAPATAIAADPAVGSGGDEKEGDAAAEADAEAEPAKMPDGVLPIFFTGQTQEIFACVCDKDVTEDEPRKLIPIASILQDFKDRAAVSDFHPCKKEMQAYTGSEVLVVYDPDFKWGQNFFVCLTEDAKTKFLEAEEAEAEGELEAAKAEEEAAAAALVARRQRGWESLGSDLEIAEAAVVPTRPRIRLQLSRRRRYFGAPCRFADQVVKEDALPVELGLCSLASHPVAVAAEGEEEPAPELHRREREQGVQAVPVTSEIGCQINWKSKRNAATQSAPRVEADGVDPTRLAKFLESAADTVEEALRENNILHLFTDDYGNLRSERTLFLSDKNANRLKENQSFKHLGFSSPKTVTCMDWHPTIPGILLVSYAAAQTFDERIDASSQVVSSSEVLIWSTASPLKPMMKLEAPEDIFSIQFCPSDPAVVAGGCVNGQVILWDLGRQHRHLETAGAGRGGRGVPASKAARGSGSVTAEECPVIRHVAASNIEASHRACITDLTWLPPRWKVEEDGSVSAREQPESTQFFTIATDGLAMLWDLSVESGGERALKQLDLKWQPHLKVYLSKDGTDQSATRFALNTAQAKDDDAHGSTEAFRRMFIGTESGDLASLDWKPPDIDGRLGVHNIDASVSLHAEPVSFVERCPALPELILSIGGSSLYLIKQGLEGGPLLEYVVPGVTFLTAAWSPTRPGVFFVGKSDGSVDVWDIVDTSYRPCIVQPISTPLRITAFSMALHPDSSGNYLLSASSADGIVRLLDIPRALQVAQPDEVRSVRAFVEREEARLAYFQELDVPQSHAEATDGEEGAAPAGGDGSGDQGYEAFAKLQREILIQLGVLSADTEVDE